MLRDVDVRALWVYKDVFSPWFVALSLAGNLFYAHMSLRDARWRCAVQALAMTVMAWLWVVVIPVWLYLYIAAHMLMHDDALPYGWMMSGLLCIAVATASASAALLIGRRRIDFRRLVVLLVMNAVCLGVSATRTFMYSNTHPPEAGIPCGHARRTIQSRTIQRRAERLRIDQT